MKGDRTSGRHHRQVRHARPAASPGIDWPAKAWALGAGKARQAWEVAVLKARARTASRVQASRRASAHARRGHLAKHLRRPSIVLPSLIPGLLVVAALAASATATSGTPSAVPADVVITEVYGGGGQPGSTWAGDFVELTNRGPVDASLHGWSVQYAAAGSSLWGVTRLAGSIPPGGHFLIAEAAGRQGVQLPPADLKGALNLSTTSGKVALVRTATPLSCVAGCAAGENVRDFVGYGAAEDAKGRPAPALSLTTAALRRDARPAPDAGETGGPAGVQAAGDDGPPPSGLDTGDNAVDFVASTPLPAGVKAGTAGRKARIAQIQGRSHLSPLAGQVVDAVPGVVTAVSHTGFWMQDPAPDGDQATSDGLFVYTGVAPKVDSGDTVRVDGSVVEYRPGGSAASGNLSTTELVRPTVDVVSGAAQRPVPVVIGPGGRQAPAGVRTDAPGDVESSPVFDPKGNALDFYESLEGMLVRVVDATVIGPSTGRGELAVVPGGTALPRTARGGLRPRDDEAASTQRILFDDTLAPLPTADVGDKLPGAVDGVMEYSDGEYRVAVLATPEVVGGGIRPEAAAAAPVTALTTASLDAGSTQFTALGAPLLQIASTVVLALRSPDIVAVGNVADDSGTQNDGTTTADRSWTALIRAIVATGGPQYSYRQIDPEDLADGTGGANRRTGFLYNPARVTFVDRSSAGIPATIATDVAVSTGSAVRSARSPRRVDLTQSPGRIAPTDPAFAGTAKSLVGEFRFRGQTVFVVANQFVTASRDDPFYGRRQPPRHPSEQQRGSQATLVRSFLDTLLSVDPQAGVVVLGGLADTESSPALAMFTAGKAFVDLTGILPATDRYSYLDDGDPQLLDHVLVSRAIATGSSADIVHTQSEFSGHWSDHDPVVGAIRLSS